MNHHGDGMASSASHFCTKLHIWLELAGLPYTLLPANGPDGPYGEVYSYSSCHLVKLSGKAPYIELNGQVYADSSAIVKMLSDKYGKDLDADLSLEQRAMSIAVQRMVEEHTYFLTLADMALQDGAFEVLNKKLMNLPTVARWIFPTFLLRSFKAILNGQGIGRLPEVDRKRRMKEDIEALSIILGEKKYLVNDDKPSTIDATVFGYLWSNFDTDSEFTKYMSCCTESEKYDNLMAYYTRMREMML
ncbi:metaxin, putative, partial [Perkinsus marinus ATCC 50983]